MRNLSPFALTTLSLILILFTYQPAFSSDTCEDESLMFFDGGVSQIVAPLSGCGLTNMEHIAVEISNYGSDTIFSTQVSYSVNFGPAVTEVYSGAIPPGEDDIYTFTASEDFSFPGFFYIVDAWTTVPADIVPSNDSLLGEIIEHRSPIGFFPYTEDFDNGGFIPLNWVQSTSDGPQDWVFISGGTPSTGTGPAGDHTTGNGFYAYTEDSNFNNPIVSLLSPCFDFTNLLHPELSFWVHSNEAAAGSDPNDLNELDLDILVNGTWINGIIPTIQHLGNNWTEFVVDLTPYAGNIVGLRFRSSTDNGTFSHDIAIDDVNIREVYSDDLSVIDLVDPPENICGDSATTVSVTIFNPGMDPQWDFPVVVEVSSAFITDTISVLYTDTLDSDETATVTVGIFNSVDGGPFTFKAYADFGVDQNPVNDTLLVTNFEIFGLPSPPNVQDQLRCEPGTFTFDANSAPNETVSWYFGPGSTNPISVGDVITTPFISNPITLYTELQVIDNVTVGPVDNTFGGGSDFNDVNNINRGLLFDVFKEFTLDSLIVYPDNSGSVTVNVVQGGFVFVFNYCKCNNCRLRISCNDSNWIYHSTGPGL